MTSERREGLLWIGGALLIALLVGGWILATSPEFDEMATRYSIL